jgi:alpha-mannosidase
LDETSLQTAVLAAADKAVGGDVAAAREHLQAAFDRLHEAREYLYPAEIRLLDLTLLAPTTLGDALRAELADGLPHNVLASGEVIAEMARSEPETLARLKQALAAGTAVLLGGEFTEAPLPLLAPEAIRLHLSRGTAAYQQHLQRRPIVFGRRRFGLTPVLPQILRGLGFTGAFHCTLDDGRFPTAGQDRIEWEGIDGTTIDSLASVPIDAGRSAPFLQLAEKLGDAMSCDRTVVLAHWPGRTSTWYGDLQRIAAYGSVLGKFSTITACLDDNSLAGGRNRYQPDEYRAPYLKQDAGAGPRDPISRWVRYFRRRTALESIEGLMTLSAICCAAAQKHEVGSHETIDEELAIAIEDSRTADADAGMHLDAELAAKLDTSLVDLARSLTGAAKSTKNGCLTVNPWSFSQQFRQYSSSLIPHPLCVSVPAMGFAWIDLSDAEPTPAQEKGWFGKHASKDPPLAEENVLRNEFCEIRFDPHTGAIQTISDYRSRDPRLGQQIALRLPQAGDPEAEANYSIMAADEIAVTSAGPVLGEIVCRGRLMDRVGHRVAGFRQTTRVWRGSRVIELEIELDVDRQPVGDPWDCYYAVRMAWKDETADLYRSVNMANLPTELAQIESPYFLDIRRGKHRTTLLCGGLPYHRRLGRRKLDTLLVVPGETARSFRLGIGIDVPHPMAAALGLIAPPLVLPDQPRPPTSTGWLFHLDCRNVLATHWAPLTKDNNTPISSSREPTAPGEIATTRGFRVRLLETDGHGVQLRLRCFRAMASARKINPGEAALMELAIEGDGVVIPIGPHQWIEVEVLFQ